MRQVHDLTTSVNDKEISPFPEDFIFKKLRICEVSRKQNPCKNFQIYSICFTAALPGRSTDSMVARGSRTPGSHSANKPYSRNFSTTPNKPSRKTKLLEMEEVRKLYKGTVNILKFQTLFSFCSEIKYLFSRLEFTIYRSCQNSKQRRSSLICVCAVCQGFLGRQQKTKNLNQQNAETTKHRNDKISNQQKA